MIRRTCLLAALVIVVLVVVGCDGLLDGLPTPLDAQGRVDAFLEDMNATVVDYAAVQENFSTLATDYSSINTSTYWDLSSYLDPDLEQPIAVTDLTAGGTIVYADATIYTGTLTTANNPLPGVEIQFAFVEDPNFAGNQLIRAIDVDAGTELIENILR